MCPETLFLEINLYLQNDLSNFQLEGGFWYLYFKGFKSVFYTWHDILLNYKVSKIILKMVGCRADKVSWFSFRPYSYNSNFWNFCIWYLKNDASDTFEAFKCPPLFFNLSVDLWSNFLSSDGCFCLFWRSYVHSKHHAFCIQQPLEKC